MAFISVAVAGVAATGLAPGVLSTSAIPFLLVPLGGLLGLALAALRLRPSRPAEVAHQRVAGMLLVAVVLGWVAYWGVRDRYRVRPREAFDRAVAERLPRGLSVVTLAPVEPAHVFHAAPEAAFARHLEDLPLPDEQPELVVIVEARRRAEVEGLRRARGRVLLAARMGDHWPTVLLLGFGLR
jgi:hypothetical protein